MRDISRADEIINDLFNPALQKDRRLEEQAKGLRMSTLRHVLAHIRENQERVFPAGFFGGCVERLGQRLGSAGGRCADHAHTSNLLDVIQDWLHHESIGIDDQSYRGSSRGSEARLEDRASRVDGELRGSRASSFESESACSTSYRT